MKCLNKKSLILATLLLTSLSFSQAASAVDSFKNTTIEDKTYENSETATEDSAAVDVYRSLTRIGAHKACNKFVTPTEFGAYGTVVTNAFRKNYFDSLEKGTDDLNAACPKYNNLPLQLKAEVWTVIISSMAFYESTCNPNASAKGTHGTARGLLQLFYGNEKQFDGGRFCKNDDAKNPQRSILCGLSMLNTYISKSGQLFPSAGSGKTYWEVLLKNAKAKLDVPPEIDKREPTVYRKANGATLIKLAIDDYKYCH